MLCVGGPGQTLLMQSKKGALVAHLVGFTHGAPNAHWSMSMVRAPGVFISLFMAGVTHNKLERGCSMLQ